MTIALPFAFDLEMEVVVVMTVVAIMFITLC